VRGRELHVLGGIVAVAALVRLLTLDGQSFWLDEAVTVGLVEMSLGDMLDRIPESESTPPLYYVVAWLWAMVFGTGEVGLRSLSALCGIAFVPVMYAAAARAAGVRAGLIAAAIAALSPILVWYSQEARAYSLLVLLAGLSFLFFIRLLTGEPRRRTLVLWALFSALALATHYFAAFLVAVEAVWLLYAAANRRPVAVAVAAVVAVQAALLPLLLHQRSLDLADFIDNTGLGYRLVRAPKQFLVGFDAPGEAVIGVAAGALVLLALWFVWSRGDERDQRAARIGAIVGGLPVLSAAVLALAGVDYLDTRNLLIAWPPLALVVAAGLGAMRAGTAGLAAAGGLVLIGALTIVFVAAKPTLQRDDWRGATEVLEGGATPRAVVVSPGSAGMPFAIYAPDLEQMAPAGAAVREIDLVALPPRGRSQGAAETPPRPAEHPPPLAGFKLVERRFEDAYTVMRFRSPRAKRVTPLALKSAHVDVDATKGVFLER